MKPIILKESEISEEETLDHCLTVIQGLLDMDDYSQAYKYLYGFTKCLITQTREETIREMEDMLPLEYHPDGDSEKGYNACLGEIKITLNKLKK